jgi:hypothetical protein
MAKTISTNPYSSSDENGAGDSSSVDGDSSSVDDDSRRGHGKQLGGKQCIPHTGKVFKVNNKHPTIHDGDAGNEISSYEIEVKAYLLPLFQLHAKSQTNIQNELPKTLAIGFNCRSVSNARLTCTDKDKNMLYKLRNETEKIVPSVLDGRVHAVMSSYCVENIHYDSPETTNNMTSVLNPLEERNEPYQAIKLTVQIILNAIIWVKGIKWKQDMIDRGENDIINCILLEINEKPSDEPTIDIVLSIFFQELENGMPTTMVPEDLLGFINNHEWGEESIDCFQNDKNGYRLRRFIHENLAKQTMVVAHIVDGIHRVTAIDCAYIGYSSTTDNEYSTKLPHKDTMLSVHAYIPTVFDVKLRNQMNNISKEVQCSGSKQMPHSIRDFLANEIPKLHSLCIEKKVFYLSNCVDAVYKVIEGQPISGDEWQVIKDGIPVGGKEIIRSLDDILRGTDQAESNNMYLLDEYISLWVENMAKIIIGMKSDDSKLVSTRWMEKYTSDIQKQEETKLSCFKKVKQGTEKESGSCNINAISSKTRTTVTFLKNATNSGSSSLEGALMEAATSVDSWKSIFTENRYFSQKKGSYYPDQGVIIYQILLWSYLCKDTNDLLSIFFSSSQPNRLQYTVGDANNAFQQTTNLFHNVIDSVAASYNFWKPNYFIKDKKKANHIKNNPEQAIHLCLLISAIKECIPYFKDLGLKPVPPEKINDIVNNQSVEGFWFDYITLLVGSHAIGMSHCGKDTRCLDQLKPLVEKKVGTINPHNRITSQIIISHGNSTSIKDYELSEIEKMNKNCESKLLSIIKDNQTNHDATNNSSKKRKKTTHIIRTYEKIIHSITTEEKNTKNKTTTTTTTTTKISPRSNR